LGKVLAPSKLFGPREWSLLLADHARKTKFNKLMQIHCRQDAGKEARYLDLNGFIEAKKVVDGESGVGFADQVRRSSPAY
jgi:hypothetical protein